MASIASNSCSCASLVSFLSIYQSDLSRTSTPCSCATFPQKSEKQIEKGICFAEGAKEKFFPQLTKSGKSEDASGRKAKEI
jgi:hypothetical protein